MEQTLKCPKCGSVALSAIKTDVQSTAIKSYVRAKCLNCGETFDMNQS